MKGIPTPYLLLALILEALFLLLYLEARTERIVTAIIILLVAGATYAIAVYHSQKASTESPKPLVRFIIAAAIVYRITLWPLAFPTTDDVYRYRWEGKLQAFGGNPYQARPADPQWAFLRDETYARVGAKDFKAGYGPAWELIEAAMYRIVSSRVADEHAQAFWFKIPPALADLGLIGAVAALLRAYGLPQTRVLIYAWSPLPIWEFWANGHNDALPVLAVVLALLWARGQPRAAAASVTIAVGLKFWPAILFLTLVRAGVRLHYLLLCLPLLGLLALPYASGVGENARFMSGFVGGWRNNDSLFGAILWVFGDPYHSKYAAFALIGAVAIWLAIRQRNLARASLWTTAALLFIASNCHPWYLTWFLPLLAIEFSAGLLLWTTVVPLFYSAWPGWIMTGVWEGVTPFRWFVYVPVFALILLRWLHDRSKVQKKFPATKRDRFS